MRETVHTLTASPLPTSVADLMGELATPAGQADPYPIYVRLRELGDAVTGPDGFLVVTGYDACSALLRDPRLRKNPGRLLTASGFPDWEGRPALRTMFASILMLNPPDHTRLRGLVSRVFTARRVAELRPSVERIADGLLSGLGGTFDFVDEVAFPFPVTVIGELLGVPPEDRPQFRELVTRWSMVLEILNPPTVDEADAAAQQIIDYFQELIARRRAEPREDLISALTQTNEAEASDDELIRLATLILGAGFETTTGLLANGLKALLENPDQAQRLRTEPELARPATEELLRYDTPVQLTYGRSAVDAITVNGINLEPRQRVVTVLGAANRDPTTFTDPGRLRLDRHEGAPLSFGGGIHHCLGAALARLEGQVMFPRLVQRFPDLRITGTPTRRPGITVHSYATLPVSTG